MEKHLISVLKTALRERAAGELLGYKEVRKGTGGGCVLYSRPLLRGSKYTGFVAFVIHESRNVFTVELAGSYNGTFPVRVIEQPAWDAPDNDFARTANVSPYSNFRFRLRPRGVSEEVWFPVTSYRTPVPGDVKAAQEFIFSNPKELIRPDLLEPSISKAFAMLNDIGIPYFLAVGRAVESFGVKR